MSHTLKMPEHLLLIFICDFLLGGYCLQTQSYREVSIAFFGKHRYHMNVKVAPYSNFNGGLVTKTWRRYACVNSDLVVSKFCDRVNINVRFLDVFFGEFR